MKVKGVLINLDELAIVVQAGELVLAIAASTRGSLFPGSSFLILFPSTLEQCVFNHFP